MWLFEGSCDWCHQKKDYVNPESSICEKFKPKVKGPLDKYLN